MDGNENSGKVQHSGQNSTKCHFRVGDVHIFRHQEGRRAHDGGHDLAAGGGCRFHCAGKFTLIPRLFHHGDGNRAGGDGVAHRGAGHHAAQGGGDDRHLGRAAGEASHQRVGQVNKKGGDACPFQKGTENDKHHNVLGADLNRFSHDAAGGVEQLVHDAFHADFQTFLREEGIEQ